MASLNLAGIIPTWMDQSFFDRVVQHMEKDPQAKVQEFNISAGSTPGDNFGSAIYRAKITFTSKFAKSGPKMISIIIKAEVSSEIPYAIGDLLSDMSVFRTEMEMYGEVLPAIKSLWLSVDDNELLCPNLIYQSTDPRPVIVLEDVSVKGFGVVATPGDLDFSQKVFRRLAKFHASTFFLHHQKKFDYANLGMSMFDMPPQMTYVLFTHGLHAFTSIAKEWEGYEKFIPHLEKFKENYKSKASKTYEKNSEGFGFNVLNHTDFHIKNLLFKKHADGSLDDLYFIDFQCCTYATPAIDIIYALYFMTTTENRQKHRAELIVLYYEQFAESLKIFGFLQTPPSLTDLQVELLRNGYLEVLIAICMSVFFFGDKPGVTTDNLDMGEGTKKAHFRLYRLPGFKEAMLAELPRFLNNGFI